MRLFLFSQPLLHHCMQLQRHEGVEWGDELEYGDTNEMEIFVANRRDNLAAYDNVVDGVKHNKSLVDSEEMATENFIRTVSSPLNSEDQSAPSLRPMDN